MYYSAPITHALRAILAICALAAIYYKLVLPEQFYLSFAREDGVVEYGTSFLLLCASLVLVGLARRLSGYHKILLFIYALAFFFAAGEEISWGQRIFGWDSGEFWLENNYQGETTLHNLVVGDIHLAEEVFGNALSLVLLSYLVVLPLLYPMAAWVRRFCEILVVPAPSRSVAALAVIWTVLVIWIDLPRQWEVYEFAFSCFACLTFLNPVNRQTFGFS